VKIASELNSPALPGGLRLPSSVYDASVGPYGVFNLPVAQRDPPPDSTEEPTTLASATTNGVADMTIKLFGGRLTDLKVRGELNRPVKVIDAPKSCNYSLVERRDEILFTAPYSACDVKILQVQRERRKTTKAPTTVVCTASSVVVELPKEPLRLVKVLDKSNQWVTVIDAPKHCNYTLLQGSGRNFFIAPYAACDVRILNQSYVLEIWYLTTGGKKGYMVLKCPTSAGEPTKTPTTTRTTGSTTKTTMTTSGGKPTVVCTASSMVVELSKEPLVLVELLGELGSLPLCG
ncbi:uncharacterized protein LOC121312289, partial [Polyodon spathula]|uniref:uncharacterized protein LOC121312289 n=1 Tax=Polyodon spathula TaxID=7913 RepID=UPI001B7E6213